MDDCPKPRPNSPSDDVWCDIERARLSHKKSMDDASTQMQKNVSFAILASQAQMLGIIAAGEASMPMMDADIHAAGGTPAANPT